MHYPEYVPTLVIDLDKVMCHLEYDVIIHTTPLAHRQLPPFSGRQDGKL